MKQFILGTFLGDLALEFKEEIHLIKSFFFKREGLGCASNDYIAFKLLTRLCDSKKTFLDVGAHIGSVTAHVMRHCSNVNLIAVEAMPDKATKFRKKFPTVVLHEIAAGDNSGEVTFFVNIEETGYSSLIRPKSQLNVREIRVQKKKLDDCIYEKNIDLIKIDVEGAELGVLRGAENIISESRPVIMFESASSQTQPEYGLNDIWQWFDQREYSLFMPNRVAHNGNSLGKDCFIDCHTYPRQTTNYFAIPNERRTEIRDKARRILRIH